MVCLNGVLTHRGLLDDYLRLTPSQLRAHEWTARRKLHGFAKTAPASRHFFPNASTKVITPQFFCLKSTRTQKLRNRKNLFVFDTVLVTVCSEPTTTTGFVTSTQFKRESAF